jgi:hypothetical protein
MKYRIMIVSKLSAAICALLLLASFAVGAAAKDNYQFYALNEAGSNYTFVFGINNSRMAMVVHWGAAGYDTSLWRNGQETPVVYPGSSQTLMGDVTNDHLVFGNIGTAEVWHAAVMNLATGTWTLLPDIADRPFNIGEHMNEKGVGVGTACDVNFQNCLGWTWDGNGYSFTTIPGTSQSWEGPYGINDLGQEVGTFEDAIGMHAYLKTRLGLTTIDMPGAVSTQGQDINNQGEILLLGTLPDKSFQIGLWRDGEFIPLPGVPGAPPNSTMANSLNDRGDYCGSWFDVDGNAHAFVALRK